MCLRAMGALTGVTPEYAQIAKIITCLLQLWLYDSLSQREDDPGFLYLMIQTILLQIVMELYWDSKRPGLTCLSIVRVFVLVFSNLLTYRE
jgi:hypothetical protein